MKVNLHDVMHEAIQKILRPLSVKSGREDIWFSKNLCWCPDCLHSGYHSLLHQFILIKTCPFHAGSLLLDACPKCNNKIPFLFTDSALGDAFTCKCGYRFIDLSTKWTVWPQEQVLADPLAFNWLNKINEGDNIQERIYIPKYISLEIINDCTQNELNKNFYRIPNLTSKEDDLYDRILEEIIENSKYTFNAIDKYIRRKYLSKHKLCIDRLQYLLKKDNEEFPPICPYAYAYVFWRQSLLGLSNFYGPFLGLKQSRGIRREFYVATPLYKEELRQLFEQCLDVIKLNDGQKLKAISWIINKASSHMYLQLFFNWLERAEKGVRSETIPRGEEWKELVHKKINFVFCLKIDQNEQPIIQFLVQQNSDNANYKCSEHKCKIEHRQHLRSFTPLAISMMNFDDDLKKKEVREYVDRYLGKLSM